MLYDQLVAVATALLLWPPMFPVLGVPITALAAAMAVRGGKQYPGSDPARSPASHLWVWVAWTVLAWEGFVVVNALGIAFTGPDAEIVFFLGWALLWHGVQTTLIVLSLLRVRQARRPRLAKAATGN